MPRTRPRSGERVHPEDQHLRDREHEHHDDAGIQRRLHQNERHNRSRREEHCDEPRKRRAVPEPPDDKRLDSDRNHEPLDARVGVAREQHIEVEQRQEDRVGDYQPTRRRIGHRRPEDTPLVRLEQSFQLNSDQRSSVSGCDRTARGPYRTAAVPGFL
jgi:hypothetical protein